MVLLMGEETLLVKEFCLRLQYSVTTVISYKVTLQLPSLLPPLNPTTTTHEAQRCL